MVVFSNHAFLMVSVPSYTAMYDASVCAMMWLFRVCSAYCL